MSDRNIGVIVLGILAVAGLGLSGYLFIENELVYPYGNPTLKTKVYKDNTAQALSDNIWVQVIFSDESYDVGNCFNLATSIFLVPKSGYYQICAGVYFDNVEDNRFYGVRVSTSSNAWLLYEGGGRESIPGFESLSITIADIVYLSYGENVTLHARRSGGSAQMYGNLYGSYTFLTIWLLE
jgi:hypothetical protein